MLKCITLAKSTIALNREVLCYAQLFCATLIYSSCSHYTATFLPSNSSTRKDEQQENKNKTLVYKLAPYCRDYGPVKNLFTAHKIHMISTQVKLSIIPHQNSEIKYQRDGSRTKAIKSKKVLYMLYA